jgi:predicted transcriptional regulator
LVLSNWDPYKEVHAVARPPARELTERELEVMHVFWQRGEATATEARDHLAVQGRDLTYTTVATLVRILADKGFLVAVNSERPFRFQPTRPFGEVSRRLVEDLVERVFQGSREQLLLCLFDHKQLNPKERARLETILAELDR